MRFMVFSGVVALSLSFAAVAQPSAEIIQRSEICYPQTEPVPWEYCVTASKNPDLVSKTQVYVLHGLNQSAKTWGESHRIGDLLEEQWTAKGAPTVVNVSFGPMWLLVAKTDGNDKSGLLDIFLKVVIPTVEKQLGQPKRRLLLGESMGGFNALQLAFLASDSFERVAILCPPIVTANPFDAADVQKFIKETGASSLKVFGAVALVKAFYKDDAAYKKVAPLALAENSKGKKLPDIYVSCGANDDYGLYPGAKQFAGLLHKNETKIAWRPLLGSHCAMDAASTAQFLAP